jgi:hypothetical protein
VEAFFKPCALGFADGAHWHDHWGVFALGRVTAIGVEREREPFHALH